MQDLTLFCCSIFFDPILFLSHHFYVQAIASVHRSSRSQGSIPGHAANAVARTASRICIKSSSSPGWKRPSGPCGLRSVKGDS